MRMKHRTLFVIYIVCLSTLIMGWNFGSDASTQENRSNTALNTCSYPRGTEDYYWGPIEVISEPIKGNDFNNLQSFHPQVIVKDGKIYTVWNDLTNLNNSGSDSDIFYRYFNGSQWSEIQIISEPVIDSNTNN